MKAEYEKLRAEEARINARKAEAQATIAGAEKAEQEADAALETALAAGEPVDRIRKARQDARQKATDAREAVSMIEAGRLAALKPYAQAVLDAAPETVEQVQSSYTDAVDKAKQAYFVYMDKLAAARGIEKGAQWVAEAVYQARRVTGSSKYMGVRFVDVDRKDREGWRQ